MSNCPDWLYIWQLVMSVLEDNAVLIPLYPYENICVKEKPVLKQKKIKNEKKFFFSYIKIRLTKNSLWWNERSITTNNIVNDYHEARHYYTVYNIMNPHDLKFLFPLSHLSYLTY